MSHTQHKLLLCNMTFSLISCWHWTQSPALAGTSTHSHSHAHAHTQAKVCRCAPADSSGDKLVFRPTLPGIVCVSAALDICRSSDIKLGVTVFVTRYLCFCSELCVCVNPLVGVLCSKCSSSWTRGMFGHSAVVESQCRKGRVCVSRTPLAFSSVCVFIRVIYILLPL